MAMTKAGIQRIMDEVPGLNDFGIGVYEERRKKPEERIKELEEGRISLLARVNECNRVCEWLDQIDKISSINDKHSSYGLKHIAEKDVDYVTNGAFIAAAIYRGYRHRITSGRPNVHFGMSERSIKAVMLRHQEEGKQNWGLRSKAGARC